MTFSRLQTKLFENKLLENLIVKDHSNGGQTDLFDGVPEDQDWRRFKPNIGDDGTAYERMRQVVKLPPSQAIAQREAIVRVTDTYAPQALRLRVAASLLRDLILRFET